jgi:hypothetical protein
MGAPSSEAIAQSKQNEVFFVASSHKNAPEAHTK